MLKELCSRDNEKRFSALLIAEHEILSSKCKQNLHHVSLLINVLIHDADTAIRLVSLHFRDVNRFILESFANIG